MTDLEMTKLCAEAMGLEYVFDGPEMLVRIGKARDAYTKKPLFNVLYDPLRDDAQAMALVKKFGLTVDPQEDKPPFTWRVVVSNDGDWNNQIFAQGSDLNRAIVECVAKMQAAKDHA